VPVSDPSKAASKATQYFALAVMVVLYAVYVVAIGGRLVIPIGAFLLAAAGYLVWGWWTGRDEKQTG
jgi:Flp pilus assembly protein TadB